MIPIIKEERNYWVVYKPAGCLCHPSDIAEKGAPTLVEAMHSQQSSPVYLTHRLDRPTAGLMILAKNAKTAAKLGQSFHHHNIRKKYLAICRGHTDWEDFIDYPLHKENFHGSKKLRGIYQSAQTSLKTLIHSEIPNPLTEGRKILFSLVSLQAHTGRTHQLRRHMAHLRHPIIGDSRHGDGKQNRFFLDFTGIRRLLLVAVILQFPDPDTEEEIFVKVDPDLEFITIQNQLGLIKK